MAAKGGKAEKTNLDTDADIDDINTKNDTEVPLSQADMDKLKKSKDLDAVTLDTTIAFIRADEYFTMFAMAVALFRYDGFSAQATFDAMVLLASKAKVNTDQFFTDVVDLLSYYMARGTTIGQRGQANSGSVEAKNRVKTLQARYRIQDNVYANHRGKNIITLSRIMNTFPEVIGEKLAQDYSAIIGDSGIVPKALSFAGGAALIPKAKEYNFLYEAFLDYSVTFSRVINRKRRERSGAAFDEVEERKKSAVWASLARNQSRLTDEFRIEFIQTRCGDFDFPIKYDPKTKAYTGTTTAYSHARPTWAMTVETKAPQKDADRSKPVV